MRQEEGSVLGESAYIRAAMTGHREAYGELVRTYQSMVYRVCLKMTGNANEAEDLAQEVFIKAFDALSEFRQDASFSTWLYQITVRKCLDWRRAAARAQARQTDLIDHQDKLQDNVTPENAFINNEQSAELIQLVDGLKEPYRTVTKLFYFKQQSYQDIAERMGTSVKTIESQLYRARKMMREKGDGLR